MIPDYALMLSKDQSAASSAGAVTDHLIDLGVARNITVGEPLVAVVTIKTTFTQSGADNPIIQWAFYASSSTAKTDSGSAATLIGMSPTFSANIGGLGPRNLQAGSRICIALTPITGPRAEYVDFTSSTSIGKRYIYGGFVVSGGVQFTAGTFDIEIMTQAQFGGSSSASDVPVYPTGITIA